MGDIDRFIDRWKKSGAAERSNFQLFLSELCDELVVARPNPATGNESENEYVFERVVRFQHDDGSQTIGRIDLYKRGSFVMEGKQSRMREEGSRGRELVQLGLALEQASFRRAGSGVRRGRGWDTFMAAAKQQAESYAKALPREDGWPPFILVVDVGNVIEIYADFSLQGKHYAQFPDRQGYRVALDDLKRPEILDRLRAIWLDPLSLDPSRRTAKVTRDIAALLAELSKSLEKRGHSPARVAGFLMRCLFTMFAERIGLLAERDPKKRKSTDDPRPFLHLLQEHVGKAEDLSRALGLLWQELNNGDYSPHLRRTLLKFNGGLFSDPTAIPLDEQDLNWLILAAQRDWTDVEPAIFGTLLERALNEKERHKLGAHYTPRAYVERLVVPTIIEPLTENWRTVQAEAADLLKKGDNDRALEAVKAFHRKLCNTRVLDPACGTGNFLYVSMELMKRLEGEVLELLADLGDDQYLLELDRHTVDPHQFLGLEINPRAVAIAELVLWIGYLQWHFRTRGRVMPAEPVLKAFANIKEQDAVLAYEKQELFKDDKGRTLTRWDGVTKKLHQITGEEIPDPDAQVPLYKYVNPQAAKWPTADFVVGNPPFIGNKRMREQLGDGYAEALRKTRPKVPKSVDYVMYWWDEAAFLVQQDKVRRAGLITTNSIVQTFNRRVVQSYLNGAKPLSLRFAVPDQHWVDSEDGADVRVSMTVLEKGDHTPGRLVRVTATDGSEQEHLSESGGVINPDLSIGPPVTSATKLQANRDLAHQGVILVGKGFRLSNTESRQLSSLRPNSVAVIRPYIIGRDLVRRLEVRFVADLYGYTEEQFRTDFPELYTRLVQRVKPQRDAVRRKKTKERWWIFAEPRSELRSALAGLERYIVTCRTARHRIFEFVSIDMVPDAKIIAIALSKGEHLAVLSSRAHVAWSDVFARLGVGNDANYNHSEAFTEFPFPDFDKCDVDHLRKLGEELDRFRKAQLAQERTLTMTKLYNVLAKLRRNIALTEADLKVCEIGLVTALKEIHDNIDVAVMRAYGWSGNLADQQVLERLVALNKERAAGERKGLVQWLRPEFQAPKEALRKPQQVEAELVAAEEVTGKPVFPKEAPDQVTAVRAMLAAEGKPIKAGELARRFKQGGRVEPRVRDLLQIMAAIGQAQTENGSRYFAPK